MNPPPLSPGAFAPPNAAELAVIARLLHEGAGIVIGDGKASMVQSRLAKRLRALGLSDYRSYLALLETPAGADERGRMLSALTTNVTHFFRENHHFELLRTKVLPPLLARARAGGKVRIWSAGCSSGQEPYSIAMVLCDLADDIARLDIRILATDIDPEMTARGRDARYDAASCETIPAALAKRFLTHDGDGARLCDPARSLVTFRELNLHSTWPMQGRFDIIFCRNVAIYFDKVAQETLWHRFEATLNPGGWLFLGHSERLPADAATCLVTAGITSYHLPFPGQGTETLQWR
ncbi:MAG: protein-glutamate O-methyltransferase [Rhodobacteraceae bacterium]|nr:protein-glutamate O-methyltransferase [Paracoccaceae bacterium]